jgi:hypothetical protein
VPLQVLWRARKGYAHEVSETSGDDQEVEQRVQDGACGHSTDDQFCGVGGDMLDPEKLRALDRALNPFSWEMFLIGCGKIILWALGMVALIKYLW